MEPQTVIPPNPWEEQPQREGSVLRGVLGAFLGACVGAIPWLLVSAFTSFYVGWLGFLIAWASVFGYKKLKGRKSYVLAMLSVVLSSVAALVLAEFGGWMVVLCTDPEWQADAARWHISVARLAFESLLMRENMHIILPNLLIGLVIGGLGIFSARRYVRQYTDPEKAAELERRAQTIRQPLTNFESTGLTLPRQFTVGMGKGRKASVTVMAVIFCLLAAFLLLVGAMLAADGESAAFVTMLILAVALGAVMVLAMTVVRRHIDVDGDRLLVKGREIWPQDIAGVSMAQMNGAIKLKGHDGKVLAQFNNAMQNAPLMLQWLKEHNIPLQG